MFRDFMEDWKRMSPEKRAKYRDDCNTKTMFGRAEEIGTRSLYDKDKLDRGDFIIARIIWDEDKEKYHDHQAFVKQRYDFWFL